MQVPNLFSGYSFTLLKSYKFNHRMKFLPLCILIAWMLFVHTDDFLSAQTVTGQEHLDSDIAERFSKMDRRSNWEYVRSRLLLFTTFHTQGMANVNGTWYLSTVEIMEHTTPIVDNPDVDRTPGQGRGYLIAYNENGDKIGETVLGDGDIYHPGGIDSDGSYIWVPVGEYRPGSRSIIYRVDAETLEAHEVFHFPDHIGALVRDTEKNRLIGYSWGSRRIYEWPLDDSLNLLHAPNGEHPHYILNPQHYIDYQDCQFLGGALALCSGISNYSDPGGLYFSLGGIDLIDLDTLRPLHQFPVELFTGGDQPRVMTQNPFFAEKSGCGLRFHFIPEDDVSRHYVFEVCTE